MRYLQSVVLVVLCCAICTGCGAAKVKELTAAVESLEAKVKTLEEANANLETELADAQQTLDQVEKIKQGYEAARAKLKANMTQLAPILGIAESPLPPFERLTDTDWIGKFAPSTEMSSGLKELQNELKGLLGTEGAKPKSKGKSKEK